MNLSYCSRVTDDGLAALISGANCPNLRVLEVNYVHRLAPALLASIQSQRPDLRIQAAV